MNPMQDTLRPSAPFKSSTAKALVESAIKRGWMRPEKSLFIQAMPVGPVPKPRERFGRAFCPECGQHTATRAIGGKKYFVFHRTSDFPMSPPCGMSGKRVE